MVSEDDKSNNIKSLNRKLDKHLVLLIKQKLGKETHFLLPQRIRQDGEALRQVNNSLYLIWVSHFFILFSWTSLI